MKTQLVRSGRIGALFAIALLVASGFGACGGGDDDADGVRATIEEIQAAYADNDAAGVCANITRRAHLLVGVMAHDTPGECELEIEKVFRWMRGDFTKPQQPQPTPEVLDVEVDGDRAVATIASPGHPSFESPFVKRDGEWRLDSVLGGEVGTFLDESGFYDRPIALDDARVMRKPVEAANVRALQGGRECPAVDTSRAPELDGGCVLPIAGPIAMGVNTVFRRWQFTEPCRVYMALRVDGQGRTWSRGFVTKGDSPCPDTKPCGKIVGKAGVEIPWRGRFERNSMGQLYPVTERACHDTCLGLSRGPLRMKVERSGKGWRFDSRTNLGDSGWQFNGPVEARASDIQLEPAA